MSDQWFQGVFFLFLSLNLVVKNSGIFTYQLKTSNTDQDPQTKTVFSQRPLEPLLRVLSSCYSKVNSALGLSTSSFLFRLLSSKMLSLFRLVLMKYVFYFCFFVLFECMSRFEILILGRKLPFTHNTLL